MSKLKLKRSELEDHVKNLDERQKKLEKKLSTTVKNLKHEMSTAEVLRNELKVFSLDANYLIKSFTPFPHFWNSLLTLVMKTGPPFIHSLSHFRMPNYQRRNIYQHRMM